MIFLVFLTDFVKNFQRFVCTNLNQILVTNINALEANIGHVDYGIILLINKRQRFERDLYVPVLFAQFLFVNHRVFVQRKDWHYEWSNFDGHHKNIHNDIRIRSHSVIL